MNIFRSFFKVVVRFFKVRKAIYPRRGYGLIWLCLNPKQREEYEKRFLEYDRLEKNNKSSKK
jgi:hypothetical protein